MRTSREYAPSTPSSASASRISGRSAVDRAIRCTITSESIVEEKIAPRSSSSRRSSVAFVRLPLWARATAPPRTLATTGCAFARIDEPAVLYRVWPMPVLPISSGISLSASPSETSPIARTECARPASSTVTIPDDSCPRCWSE